VPCIYISFAIYECSTLESLFFIVDMLTRHLMQDYIPGNLIGRQSISWGTDLQIVHKQKITF